LNRLCQKLFINKSYFCQIFKAETGETLTSYITRKRLSKAMELLKASNLKIYEVADRVGFSNQYYFSNVFSKYYGFSPKYVKKIK
jgi:two-component system response regulator YesN